MSSKLDLLTSDNCQLIFIDHQPQMAFGVQSIDRQVLKNNVVALAKSAKVFDIPTTITTVETESFSGYTYPELLGVFPDHPLLERTSMNSWDDQKVRDALAKNGQKKVVVSGLWTEVCINNGEGPSCSSTRWEAALQDADPPVRGVVRDGQLQVCANISDRPPGNRCSRPPSASVHG